MVLRGYGNTGLFGEFREMVVTEGLRCHILERSGGAHGEPGLTRTLGSHWWLGGI